VAREESDADKNGQNSDRDQRFEVLTKAHVGSREWGDA
jgi:hypothetical protein